VAWDWTALGRVVDDLVVTAGIALLVVRQFVWRSAAVNRMLRLPLLIIAAGIGYLVAELRGGFPWVAGDGFLLGELALVAVTGVAMGLVTRFRTVGTQLQYRLTAPGLWLWAAFVVIRVAFLVLATRYGANLADATGVVLLSFGTNRLTAIVVVRRRAERWVPAGQVAGPGEPSGGGGGPPRPPRVPARQPIAPQPRTPDQADQDGDPADGRRRRHPVRDDEDDDERHRDDRESQPPGREHAEVGAAGAERRAGEERPERAQHVENHPPIVGLDPSRERRPPG